MWAVVVGTALGIRRQVFCYFDPHRAFDFAPGAFASPAGFFCGLGGATLIAMYDYGGYNMSASLRRGPATRTRDPGSILSPSRWGTLYLTMNITIIGVIPWREAIRSQEDIVSDFIQPAAARARGRLRRYSGAMDNLRVDLRRMLGLSRVLTPRRRTGGFLPVRRCCILRRTSVLFLGCLPPVSPSAAARPSNLAYVSDQRADRAIEVMIQFMAQVIAVPSICCNCLDISHGCSRCRCIHLPSAIAFLGLAADILIASGLPGIIAGFARSNVGVGADPWARTPYRRIPSRRTGAGAQAF